MTHSTPNSVAIKCFCITFFLFTLLCQPKTAPAYQAAAQNDNRATNESPQAAPTVEQHLGDKETPPARGNAQPVSDKIRAAEWVQIFISTLVAMAVFWTAWTYNEQRKLMGRQLDAMNRQAGVMGGQLTAMQSQGRAMTESLIQNQRAVSAAEQSVEIVRDANSDARTEAYHQREMMQRQLDLMNKQVEAAQATAKTAELNTRYTQRAYVTVTKRQGDLDGFKLTIENSGNTPATEVVVWAVADFGSFPPDKPDRANTGRHTWIGILAPRDRYEMFVPYSRKLTEEQKELYSDPVLTSYWWCVGFIQYRDIFQSAAFVEYHETDFAFYQKRARGNVEAWESGNAVKEHYRENQNPN
jgi:hypothetical protein